MNRWESLLADLTSPLAGAWPFVLSGVAVLTLSLALVVYLTRRTRKRAATEPGKSKGSLENRLTFVVAVIAAGIAAQGMWRFFRDILGFPVELRIVAFAVLELVTFTCALRARRNVREAKRPEDARAGVDGVAVWVVTALSGVFSATDAHSAPEGAFRLAMPLLAAWLWERGMSIERRKARGGSTIHWRVTPERVLVWLRVAEPSGRTASEVDAHRRLSRLARSVAKVRALRQDDVKGRPLTRARRRRDRAMRAAVAHANLATDPARKREFIAQLAALCDADALTGLVLDAHWDEFASAATDVTAPETVPETVVDGYALWDTIPPDPGTPENTPGNVPGNAENTVPQKSDIVPPLWPLPLLEHSSGALVGAASKNGYGDVPRVFPKQVNGHAASPGKDAEELDSETVKNAREAFSAELGNGESISVRQIMSRCNCGYPKAKRIKAVLDPE